LKGEKMAEWALYLAIIALALIGGIVAFLAFILKQEIISLKQEIDDLPKKIAEQVVANKDFQMVLERTIAEKTKSIIAGSIGQIINFILLKANALIREHLMTFDSSKLIREVDKKMQEVLSQNQQNKEEKTGQG